MSEKLKLSHPKIKARQEKSTTSKTKISVTLSYLTKNKEYSFEFFGKNFRGKLKAYEQFVEFLRRLTRKTWLEVISLSKYEDCGFETIPFAQVNFEPCGVILGKDTKIYIFRFGNSGAKGDYRLLGFFEDGQATLDIIGFDFNYSAYEH